MPPKPTNEFAKRAENLLGRRVETVQRLGELLETKAKQEAALAHTEDLITKAVAECVAAGWSQAELIEIGVPKQSKRGRRPAAATPPPTPQAPRSE